MGQQRIPGALQISRYYYTPHRCIDFGLKYNFLTSLNMYSLFHIAVVYLKKFHD